MSREAAREAVSSRSMFNVIHLETGFKVDFIRRIIIPDRQDRFVGEMEGLFQALSREVKGSRPRSSTGLSYRSIGTGRRF